MKKEKIALRVDDKTGIKSLLFDGMEKACPFHIPTPVKANAFSQESVMMNRACGSWCALFVVESGIDGRDSSVVQGCSGRRLMLISDLSVNAN